MAEQSVEAAHNPVEEAGLVLPPSEIPLHGLGRVVASYRQFRGRVSSLGNQMLAALGEQPS